MPSKAPTTSPSYLNSIPKRGAGFEETWSYLHDGIEHIMSRLEQESLSFTAYTNLYTAVYRYSSADPKESLVGSELYNKLSVYFMEHFKPMIQASETLQDADLVRYYAEHWERYSAGASYLNHVFVYLNRYWVRRERAIGKTIYPVYTLALVQWKQEYFTFVQQQGDAKLINAVLLLIAQQRNDEITNQGFVKKVIDSLVSLGLDPKDPDKVCLDIYEEHFERPFIVETEQYYKKESEIFLAENSVSDYLKKAVDRLKEEEDRAERDLHTKTRKELIAKCEHVLIREHAELMWQNFQSLLDYDKDEDLHRTYALLSRIPEGLEPLQNRFEAHVKQAGLSAISKLIGQDGSTDSLDPKAYVDALLEVHQKYFEIVNRSFKGEAGFEASFDKACREFVNRSAATATSSSKPSGLITKYADMLLRMNSKVTEEDDLESKLNRVVILFKYLEDKDIFQAFYTTELSMRLIHGLSSSYEAEASMIRKLRVACGFEHTNKLQCMFTDMSVGKDLTDSFKLYMMQDHPDAQDITFSIRILGTNFWPLNPPTHNFVIPTEIAVTHVHFQEYYQTKHSGRKLTWLWNHSKNELLTNYLNQKYILVTSSYQMAVLLQYNKCDTLSLNEIQAATAISTNTLLQVLSQLVKAKILISHKKEQYDLNPNFKSMKIRVNLSKLPIKTQIKAESSYFLKAVDEDRKYIIQATIVRIMKTRKMLKNQALIQQVISQISQRFVPKIPDISNAIGSLLEKEFIERVDGSKDIFAYVA